MNIGIMPITGIPLPFVSYGGSSLITNLFAIGFLKIFGFAARSSFFNFMLRRVNRPLARYRNKKSPDILAGLSRKELFSFVFS